MASWSTTKSWTPAALISIDTTRYTFSAGKYAKDSANFVYSLLPLQERLELISYQTGMILKDFQNWVPQWNYSAIERDTIH